MAAPRLVDRKLASKMRAEGWPVPEIADYFDVSEVSIYTATDEAFRTRQRASSLAISKSKRVACEGGCGALVWNHYGPDSPRAKNRGKMLCRTCQGKARTKTVRKNTLLCTNCGEWKPDDNFPAANKNKARRLRHAYCRDCQTQIRREYRWRYAATCADCGGPRGGDTDSGADYRHRTGKAPGTRSGVCYVCLQKRRKEGFALARATKGVHDGS